MERLVGEAPAGERREGVIPMGAIRDGQAHGLADTDADTDALRVIRELGELLGELVHLLGQRLLCERGALSRPVQP